MRRLLVFPIGFLLVILSVLAACSLPTPSPTEGAVQTPTNRPTISSEASSPTPPEPTTPPSEPADIVFHNGVVITLEEGQPAVSALAVKGDRIQAVGADEDILALADEETILIDLDGHALLPGFIETHSHLLFFAEERAGLSLEEAQQVALSYGWTGLTEMVGETFFVEEMLAAEEQGRLNLRVNLFSNVNYGFLDETGNTIFVEDAWLDVGEPILDHERMFRTPGVKIFMDGAFVPGRGCPALNEPFPENFQAEPDFQRICFNENGDLYLDESQLVEIITKAQQKGFQTAFHAFGDRAIEVTLNAIETALNGESNTVYRHQIHHNSVLDPAFFSRYQELEILASVRGYFNTCDQDLYAYWYNDERGPWAASRFALPGLGVHAFAEGDFGWTTDHTDRTSPRPIDPMLTLYGMVTRQQLRADGSVCEPADWLAKDSISVEEALKMLTIEPAYAVRQEDFLGTLLPGKYADVIILSADPLSIPVDDLKDLNVLMAMVDGQTRFCEAGFESLCP